MAVRPAVRLALVGLVVAVAVGCSGGPGTPSAVTLHSGDKGLLTLTAARYRVDWQAAGCSFVRLEWAPTSAGAVPIEIPADPPSGSVTVSITGQGYLNRTSNCELTVMLTPL